MVFELFCHSRPQTPRSFRSASRIATFGLTNFLSLRGVLVLHSQPIRFVRESLTPGVRPAQRFRFLVLGDRECCFAHKLACVAGTRREQNCERMRKGRARDERRKYNKKCDSLRAKVFVEVLQNFLILFTFF